MANSELVGIVIVFRAGPGQPSGERAEYGITRAERDRLVQEMTDNPKGIGAYDILWGNDPRKLVLRFSDVLYIG